MSTPTLPAPAEEAQTQFAPVWASLIAPPEEILGPPRSIELFGPAGAGKTTAAGSLIKRPDINKILFVDVDRGTEVLVNDPVTRAAVQSGQIQILPIDQGDPQAFAKLTSLIQDLSTNNYGYDAVVFDTFGQAYEIATDYFLKNTFTSNGQIDTQKGWGELKKWGVAMWTALHNAPHFLVVGIFHEKAETSDMGRVLVIPALQGSLKTWITSKASIVAHLSYERNPDSEDPNAVELVATVGASDIYPTKVRYNIPPRIRNFSMDKLLDAIDEARGQG